MTQRQRDRPALKRKIPKNLAPFALSENTLHPRAQHTAPLARTCQSASHASGGRAPVFGARHPRALHGRRLAVTPHDGERSGRWVWVVRRRWWWRLWRARRRSEQPAVATPHTASRGTARSSKGAASDCARERAGSLRVPPGHLGPRPELLDAPGRSPRDPRGYWCASLFTYNCI